MTEGTGHRAVVERGRPPPPELGALVAGAEAAAAETRRALERLVGLLEVATAEFDNAVPCDGTDSWPGPWRAWGLERIWAALDGIADTAAAAAKRRGVPPSGTR